MRVWNECFKVDSDEGLSYSTWTKNERNVLQFSILRVNAGDTVDGVCGGVGGGGGWGGEAIVTCS